MGIIRGLLRLVFGLLGLVLTLFGLLMLVFEIMVWIPDSSRAGNSLGQVWFQNDPFAVLLGTDSLPLFGAIIERRLSPLIWDPFIVTILSWDSWLALLVVGVSSIILGSISFSLFRPRRAV